MRSFLIVWAGQFVSLLGSSLTDFALGVWIFRETGMATPFAITALCSLLPSLLLAPVGGSFADRHDRKRIILIADTANALVTLLAFALVFSGNLQVWMVFALATAGSITRAFQGPAFSASVPMLVPKEKLVSANGLRQLSGSISHLLAPLVAGLLYGFIGLAGIMLIDFVTYFFALGAILVTRIPMPETVEAAPGAKKDPWSDLRYSFKYLGEKTGMLGLLFVFASLNFVLSLSGTLLAPYVLSTGTESDLGFAQLGMGLGMLAGALATSLVGNVKRRIPAMGALLLGMGIAIAAIVLIPGWLGVAICLFVALALVGPVNGLAQSLFQTKIAPGMMGRVGSAIDMVATIAMPFAFVLVGPLADGLFEPALRDGGWLANTAVGAFVGVGPGRGMALLFAFSGVSTALIALWLFLNKRMHAVDDLPDELPDAAESTPSGEAPSASTSTDAAPLGEAPLE
jgi:MFS family permease